MLACILLFVVSVSTSQAIECYDTHTDLCESEEMLKKICQGGLVYDELYCCKVCAKVEGEPCGGIWVLDGKCDQGLFCDASGRCAPIPNAKSVIAEIATKKNARKISPKWKQLMKRMSSISSPETEGSAEMSIPTRHKVITTQTEESSGEVSTPTKIKATQISEGSGEMFTSTTDKVTERSDGSGEGTTLTTYKVTQRSEGSGEMSTPTTNKLTQRSEGSGEGATPTTDEVTQTSDGSGDARKSNTDKDKRTETSHGSGEITLAIKDGLKNTLILEGSGKMAPPSVNMLEFIGSSNSIGSGHEAETSAKDKKNGLAEDQIFS